MKQKQISFTLDEGLDEQLRVAAFEKKLSKAAYIRTLLAKDLKNRKNKGVKNG